MLAKLRREFIAITMLLVGLVLVAVFGLTLLSNALTLKSATARTLSRAIEGEITSVTIGEDDMSSQSADVMLAVVVDLTSDGRSLTLTSPSVEIPRETLLDVTKEALASSFDEGESEEYSISWKRAQMPWGWRVALVDTSSRNASLRSQALNSLIIFAVSMAALFAVSWLLSGWVLRPVERAWDQQRRFVSDASHELKTPLAVILANMQILERDSSVSEGSMRWVVSTREEATHMKELVEDLLTLARADEGSAGQAAASTAEPTDLSALVSGCCLEFDAVAFERGCSIETALTPGIVAPVPPENYRRVVRTLLDNATKYAHKDSVVKVSLVSEGRRSKLEVNNQGDVIEPEELEHLFDRFYRTDKARERSSEGGFGLGLAIAKSMVEGAGGTISVRSSAAEGTTFTVLI